MILSKLLTKLLSSIIWSNRDTNGPNLANLFDEHGLLIALRSAVSNFTSLNEYFQESADYAGLCDLVVGRNVMSNPWVLSANYVVYGVLLDSDILVEAGLVNRSKDSPSKIVQPDVVPVGFYFDGDYFYIGIGIDDN